MIIEANAMEQILRHSENTYPEECCGLLLGRVSGTRNHVMDSIEVSNSSIEDRERRYTISSEDFILAERKASEAGLDIVGIYHSHPDHPARPSQTDLDNATFPGYSYVIVSLENGTCVDVASWNLASDRTTFEFDSIEIIRRRQKVTDDGENG